MPSIWFDFRALGFFLAVCGFSARAIHKKRQRIFLFEAMWKGRAKVQGSDARLLRGVLLSPMGALIADFISPCS